jgi:hypothetical protein
LTTLFADPAHDNAITDCTFCQRVLIKESIVVLEHAAYIPDVASCDFHFFPTMKNLLKGSHFEIVEEIQKVTMAILNNLQQNDF